MSENGIIGRLTLRTYVVGFVSSLVLTLTAYFLVTHHELNRRALIASVAALAFVQFLVQAFCFLHLGRESKPRLKLLVFGFMLLVVTILVAGSLWIMYNLNYHMTPQQINNYLKQQDGGI